LDGRKNRQYLVLNGGDFDVWEVNCNDFLKFVVEVDLINCCLRGGLKDVIINLNGLQGSFWNAWIIEKGIYTSASESYSYCFEDNRILVFYSI
jgi:hypothetical protein